MHSTIIDWIHEYKPRNVSLLIRHAHRYPIPKGVVEHQQVPLTKKGRTCAREFGTRLPPSYVLRLFHSPVYRCKETAEQIMKGFHNNGGSAKVVGDQEFLVIKFADQREMVRLLDELGHHTFGYRWLKGQFDERIMEKPEYVASTTIKGVIALMEHHMRLSMDIHITHDLNILAVREFIAPVQNEQFDWPAYLDGIMFLRNEENVTLMQGQFSKTIKIAGESVDDL